MSDEGTPLHSTFDQFAATNVFEDGLQQVLKQHEKALRRFMMEIWSNHLAESGLAWEEKAHHMVPAGQLIKPILPSSEERFQEQAEGPNVERRDLQEQQVEIMMPCTRDVLKQDSQVHINVATGLQSKTEEPITQSSDIQSNGDDNLGEADMSATKMSFRNVENNLASYVREHMRSGVENMFLHYFKLDTLLDTCRIAEPKRVGSLAQFVQSHTFHFMVIAVIIFNCIHTIVDTNWNMRQPHTPKSAFTQILEISFAFFYLVEVTLRLTVHRWYFFCNNDMYWNLLDILLVVVNVAEIVLQGTGLKSSNLVVTRTTRVFRVTKVLRVVRLVYFLTELRLMVTCLLNSGWQLLWAVVVLCLVKLIFAVLMVQQIGVFLQTQGSLIPEAEKTVLFEAFGSVEQGVLTLFMDISGGEDWGGTYNIIKPVGPLARFLYLLYIVIMWLSVTNIISSMFIEKALKIARPDLEEKMMDECEEDLEAIKELKELFQMMDLDKSSSVSYREFQTSMHDVRIQSYFELKGISITQASILFEMLARTADGDEIDVDTFVAGCLRMKGYATNIDMIALSHQVQLLSNTVDKHNQHLRQSMKEFDSNLCQALGTVSRI